MRSVVIVSNTATLVADDRRRALVGWKRCDVKLPLAMMRVSGGVGARDQFGIA